MDKKTESLVLLMEECSEVIQAATKILRWGPDSNNNGILEKTNMEHLITEMGDVVALCSMVAIIWGINPEEIEDASVDKLERLKLYSGLFK